MNDLQEGHMDSTGRTTVIEHEDLFVVRARIAADVERARTENLARAARSDRRTGGPIVWLGHKMVAVGTVLAGDTGFGRTPSAGRSA
jgi:hypothetical protein